MTTQTEEWAAHWFGLHQWRKCSICPECMAVEWALRKSYEPVEPHPDNG